MSRKRTTGEFIEESKETHGDKYDYSEVNYTRKDDNVIIICPEHGKFQQIAGHHLRGRACPFCSKRGRRTSEQFIKEAIEIHGGRFDYSEVKFKNITIKVDIICKKHGKFLQSPSRHLEGRNGCKGCLKEAKQEKYTKSNEQFLKDVIEKHGNEYNYDKTKYKTRQQKVTITCKKHGDFEQYAGHHLKGHGCWRCANETTMGKNEKNIFLPFISNIDKNFIPQHEVKKEKFGCYFVDFYYPDKHIVVEYDEPYHKAKKVKLKDDKRQKYIEEKLGCKFIRVDEIEFLSDPIGIEKELRKHL